MKIGIAKEEVSLIGFEIHDKDKIISEIMSREKISERDFVIKELPELSAEGGTRKMLCEAENLEVGKLKDDELNPGMKKVLIKFRLRKGSYATEFLKELFSAHP